MSLPSQGAPEGAISESLATGESPVKKRRRSPAGKANQNNGSNPKPPPSALQRFLRRPLVRVGSILLLGSGAICGGLAYGRHSLLKDLPDPRGALTFQRPGTLTIRSVDGEVLQRPGPSTQEPLKIVQIPDRVIDAFVASEDQRFFKHDGVDYTSIFRAVWANLTARGVVEGGSTITQQLARVAFLDQDKTLTRKLKEALLAQEIERSLTKKQVLERYLNLVYLGSGAYGVADAAWVYFGKSIHELSLSEAAMIAGLPPAPSLYSPLVNPKFAAERRNVVLARMVDAGYITDAEAARARREPIKPNGKTPKYLDSRSPYFTTYVQKELEKHLTQDQLAAGGLTVETTLNTRWQTHAEKMLQDVVANEGYYERFDQAAIAVVDPRNGEIRVMVGGNDFGKSQFNRATQAQRQPGSTFKPFVYAAGIAAGFSPYDSYKDAPVIIDGYQPKNFGDRYRGYVSMMDALTSSINIVAIKTLLDVGYNPVIKMIRAMGIESKIEPTYSMALGSWEVNLLEITSAYGSFANQGVHIPAHSVIRVLDRNNKVIFDAKKAYPSQKAIDPTSSAIITWMMKNVVNEGTGAPAYLGDRDVAGKTGTSEKARDLWFIGFIPQYVAGVWLGNDDDYPTAGSSGTAAMLWKLVMKEITKDLPPEDFPELPTLEGRKGSIKAEPIKPNSIREVAPPARDRSSEDGSYSDGGDYSDSGYSDGGDSGYSDSGYSGGGDSGYSDSSGDSGYSDGGGYSEPAYSEPAPAPEPVYEAPPEPPPVYEDPPAEEPPPPPPPF